MTLKSHASASANPPAKQWPLRAAMVIRGKVRRRVMKEEKMSAEGDGK